MPYVCGDPFTKENGYLSLVIQEENVCLINVYGPNIHKMNYVKIAVHGWQNYSGM